MYVCRSLFSRLADKAGALLGQTAQADVYAKGKVPTQCKKAEGWATISFRENVTLVGWCHALAA